MKNHLIAVFLGYLTILPSYGICEIKAAYDLSQFRYDDKTALVELNYTIPVHGLTFVASQDSFQAQVTVQVDMYKDSLLVQNDAWRMVKSVIDSTTVDGGLNMLDKIKYVLEPGNYTITMSIKDINNSDNGFSKNRDFQVVNFSEQQVELSSITLAATIKKRKSKTDTPDIFYKHGLEVTPKPSGVFTFEAPMLFYYVEAYNLASMPGDKFKTLCQVLDINDQALGAIKPRHQVKDKLESSVEVGAVNISALPTGIYVLEISVLDAQDDKVASTFKRFRVYNPDVEQSVQTLFENIEAAVAASVFAFMSEKELNDDWEKTKYITSQDEKEFYKSLKKTEAKRTYIYQFWAKRDPSVMTMVNEFREIYLKKIEYANDHYRSFTRPGWKTDRGRVYVLYGLPGDVERFHNNPNAFSYEIWRYDGLEGGVEFVFADLQEYGEFMQLHSTKRGEPSNRNWQAHIRKN